MTEHSEVPAGYIDTGSNEMNVRVTGEAGTTKEFSSIIIPGRQGQPLWRKFTIGDIGTVEEGLADVRRISRTMGEPTVSLGIRKQRGTNAVQVADAVKARIKEMQKYMPEGVKLNIRFDTTKFIRTLSAT